MMKRTLYTALFLALLANGCELVADFDRTKIPGNNPDSGVIVTPPDEEDDAGDEDAGK
jgi:hypothetical protein